LSAPLFPRELGRKKWTARGPAFALAIAITFIGELQTAALSIFLKATGHPPSAIGPTLGPAGARRPD
jgi:hypothetical protein